MGILYEYATKENDTWIKDVDNDEKSNSNLLSYKPMSKSEILDFLVSKSIFFVTQYIIKSIGIVKIDFYLCSTVRIFNREELI